MQITHTNASDFVPLVEKTKRANDKKEKQLDYPFFKEQDRK